MNDKGLMRECIAEFIGTAILLAFGSSAVITWMILGEVGTYWEMSLIWGLAVAFAVYTCGGVSGAHINPAVTVPLAIFNKFPWKKVPYYIVSQVAGAFAGAAFTFSMYFHIVADHEAQNNIVRGGPESVETASIWSTYNHAGASFMHAIWIEVLLTMILVFVIFAVIDTLNISAPQGGHAAIIIGLTVAAIGGAWGPLTGFAINPARDLGPKIFKFFAGWGEVALPGPDFYFIVPIIGPIIGGILGAFIWTCILKPYFLTDAETAPEEAVEDIDKEGELT
ncbi:MIP/aquaporin family protein [Natranaerofaba carboxydovora]|uniref:MIP/aquaporin family protein n=1 Tax=Natranaerofaba carboxydovora TaxID=2742683 RepID=UPI001F13C238|nr:MIP family channel protein [Natranaerofaba carboxydovora]UMZ73458.1 Glycerol uptake facilitator protein [Natranaerofaba carboxydovora]